MTFLLQIINEASTIRFFMVIINSVSWNLRLQPTGCKVSHKYTITNTLAHKNT
jgi:hypothetical protein